jgi:hypothetical protein
MPGCLGGQSGDSEVDGVDWKELSASVDNYSLSMLGEHRSREMGDAWVRPSGRTREAERGANLDRSSNALTG